MNIKEILISLIVLLAIGNKVLAQDLKIDSIDWDNKLKSEVLIDSGLKDLINEKDSAWMKIKKSAELGNMDAKYILARKLLLEQDRHKIDTVITESLMKNALNGHLFSISELIDLDESLSNEEKLMLSSVLDSLILNGQRRAKIYKAKAHLNGSLNLKSNSKKSFQLLKTVSDIPDTWGYYQLGVFYLTGEGGEIDYLKSKEFFEMGTSYGHHPSLYSLGYQYFKGLGVDQSYTQALDLFQKAAKLGNVQAHIMIASCYYYGLGVDESKEMVIKHLDLAIKAGNTQAFKILDQISKKKEYTYSRIKKDMLPKIIFDEVKHMAKDMDEFVKPSNTKLLYGNWIGEMITYDWSGNLNLDEGIVQVGIELNELNEIELNLKIIKNNQDLYCTQNVKLTLDESFNNPVGNKAKFAKYNFVNELDSLEIIEITPYLLENITNKYLKLDIQTWNSNTGEKGRPIQLILKKQSELYMKSMINSIVNYRVYPIPFRESFNLEFASPESGEMFIQVSNMQGKIIKEFTKGYVEEGNIIKEITELRQLNNGLYILTVSVNSNHFKTAILKD